MKKRKLLLEVLLGASLFGLASCNKVIETSSNSTPSESESKPSESESSSSSEEYKDTVTESLKLNRSIVGQQLFGTGLEEVTLSRLTDGDTSTFKTKTTKKTLTVRYLGIDTPESTAGYDKWGKAASKWNASILSKATTILLEAEGTEPGKDSNGSRYLCYVWYKLPGDTNYKNYNLQCVEEGFSDYTGSADTCKYNKYFVEARNKAFNAGKRIHGDEVDIYYPETLTPVTIKELNEHKDLYFNKETDVPTRVMFDAFITNIESSSSGFITAKVGQNIDGDIYEYSISVGYASSGEGKIFTNSNKAKGSLIHICGFTTADGDLHGLTAGDAFLAKGDEYTRVIKSVYVVNITNAPISKAYVEDGKHYIEVTFNGQNYKIEIKNSTYTAETLTALVGKNVSGTIYNQDNSSTTIVEMLCYNKNIKISE
jgi:endonuclease YncB( thermonuclease family)